MAIATPFSNGGRFESIETLMAGAEYPQAQKVITEKLKQKDLSPEQRAQLYWHKALCHLSEDQNALARSSFLKLLATTPSFKPDPNISPKILAIYTETYEKFKEQGGLEQSIKSTFIPLETTVAGDPIAFQVKINDQSSRKHLGRLEFHIRRLGNSEYSSLDFVPVENADDSYEVTVPPVLTRRVESDAAFEYYVDFLSSDETRLGGIGKNTLPLTFVVTPKSRLSEDESKKEARRNFMTAAVWISAATLTIGGIIAATLAFSTPQEGSLSVRVFPAE